MIFEPGNIINEKYEIIDFIGEGGFGLVYKIKDLEVEEFRALKCLNPQLVEDCPDLISSFDREVNAIKQVNHENVVKIFSVEETEFEKNKVKFFTMEYTSEGNLSEFLKQQDTYLSEEKLLRWVTQLLLALTAINEKVIHRDIKPENILVFGENVKISDFGLSRFIEESTRTLTFKGLGTPLYMAPEIWENATPTISIDQYSMGLVFYFMSTLKHPFLPIPSEVNPNEYHEYLRDCHLFVKPKEPIELNPRLPEKLNNIIIKMLEKEPISRFENPDKILSYLEEYDSISEQNIPSYIEEVVKIANKTIEKSEAEEKKKRLESKKREEEYRRRQDIFEFHCQKLISSFDGIVDNINRHIKNANTKIRKIEIISSPHSHMRQYTFCNKGLTVEIEKCPGVNEVPNIIAWGKCYIDAYEDGFNLLLQLKEDGPYATWLSCEVEGNSLYPTKARYLRPHAVLEFNELNDALRGLHATHRYIVDLKELDNKLFINLVKKLVSI